MKCYLICFLIYIFVKHNELTPIKAYITMAKLKKLSLSRILKLDLRLLIEEITETLDMFDLQALYMQDIYRVLKNQEGKMQVIDKPYGKHPLTRKIAELHKKRLRYATIIYMNIRTLEKLDCKETQQKALLAKRLAKLHLTYLGQKRHDDVNLKLYLFFSALKTDTCENEHKAFISLGLKPYLNELNKTNDDYKALVLERTLDIKNRPATGNRALENETKKILRVFFEQVSSFQKTFTEIDYGPLIRTLNVTLTENSKLIKTRLATNKRKARKKKEAAKKNSKANKDAVT